MGLRRGAGSQPLLATRANRRDLLLPARSHRLGGHPDRYKSETAQTLARAWSESLPRLTQAAEAHAIQRRRLRAGATRSKRRPPSRGRRAVATWPRSRVNAFGQAQSPAAASPDTP